MEGERTGGAGLSAHKAALLQSFVDHGLLSALSEKSSEKAVSSDALTQEK